ncbi:hypothetical protein FNF31_05311 [Cafeteria roenbergensis]|nr:hypothetical protein FNF31_05311 [Cafeteria roenbergensis]
MTITPLGAGNEVGRSCILLAYKGKKILLDCGVLPSFSGERCLPFLHDIDPSTLDIIIITHFHLDHAAALPVLTERMVGFRGRIFATPPTVAVMQHALLDFQRRFASEGEAPLYSEEDLRRCLDRIETVDVHQKIEVDSVRITFFHAQHVLGAVMALVEIGHARVLYTGDYSREPDRHLPMAEIPSGLPPDVLIVEATFGIRTHEDRNAREHRLLSAVRRVVERGGHVLLPLGAFGRAQEIMLMLDEYWAANPELHSIPIYYAAPSAIKALQLYRAFTSYMTRSLQATMGSRNPWDFRHIWPLRDARTLSDSTPCVVIAAPGMLQGGVSRSLFERWCQNPADAVIVAGYCVEGTLAKDILRNPHEITAKSGRKLALRCDVEEVQFAAHADYAQTSELVDALNPESIVLVHGEATEMRRLHQALAKRHRSGDASGEHGVFMPKNQSAVTRLFRQDRSAKAVGLMADADLAEGRPVSGVLVRRAFSLSLVDERQVPTFTPLQRTRVEQRMSLPYRAPWEVARHYLQSVFDDVVDVQSAAGTPSGGSAAGSAPASQGSLLVSGVVRVTHSPPTRIDLEWLLTPAADVVADGVVAVLAQAEYSPMSLAGTGVACCPPAPPVPGAAVATALSGPVRHRFCPPGCEPDTADGASASTPKSASSLPPHLSAVLGDVSVSTGPSSDASGEGALPSGQGALADPVSSPVDPATMAPLQTWKQTRRDQARQRASAMLKAVLQEWFGPECVKLDADRATVACDGASAVLNLAAMAVEPAAEGETVSAAAATLRDSLRLAVAHCREVNLGAV